MGDKNYKGRGELDPAKDLRVLGELQQLGNGFVRCFQFAQLKHPSDLHLAEHLAPPPLVGANLESDWIYVGCQN